MSDTLVEAHIVKFAFAEAGILMFIFYGDEKPSLMQQIFSCILIALDPGSTPIFLREMEHMQPPEPLSTGEVDFVLPFHVFIAESQSFKTVSGVLVMEFLLMVPHPR